MPSREWRFRIEDMCDAPIAMIQAVNAVVHQNMKPAQALELYETMKQQKAKARK